MWISSPADAVSAPSSYPTLQTNTPLHRIVGQAIIRQGWSSLCERTGQSFDYVLVTNEFDPARLAAAAAAERQREGNPLFTSVVHVSTEALQTVYGNGPSHSFAKALAHISSGRIQSLADWFAQLQR